MNGILHDEGESKMEYKKTIAAFNELRNAEVEVLRFSDPREADCGARSYVDLRKMNEIAFERETNRKKKMELKMMYDLIDYKNFYSEELEKKVAILKDVQGTTNLKEIATAEQAELAPFIQEMKDSVNNELKEAQAKIQVIIDETKRKVSPTIKSLTKIEQDEVYLFNSGNSPINTHINGIGLYAPEVKPLIIRPHEQVWHKWVTPYTQLNIKEKILGGVK